MTEKLLDVSHSDENIQLNDSYKNTQSQKEMLNEKYKDLIILREENDNLVEKLSNLLTEIVNKKQGFRNIYLDIESANKKKKDLETENYVLNTNFSIQMKILYSTRKKGTKFSN